MALLASTAIVGIAFADGAAAQNLVVNSDQTITTTELYNLVTLNNDDTTLTIGNGSSNNTVTASGLTQMNNESELVVSTGSTYNADGGISTSNSDKRIIVHGTLNATTINFGNGDDLFRVSSTGVVTLTTLNMDDDDDNFRLNGGSFSGNLNTNDDDDDVRLDGGTFTGNINTGSNGDYLRLEGGTVVTGNIALGSGIDELDMRGATVNGNVDGGNNSFFLVNDTANFSGTNLITGDLTGFPVVNMNGGTTTVAGAGASSVALFVYDGDATFEYAGTGSMTFTLGILGNDDANHLVVSSGTMNLQLGALFGDGNDSVTVGANGSPSALFQAGVLVDFGDDDDTLRIFNGGQLDVLAISFGSGHDVLEFTGDGNSTFSFTSGLFVDSDTVNTNVPFFGNVNIPVSVDEIKKTGTGTWTLESPLLTSVGSVTVDEGILNLTGNWLIAGNTITVNPASTMNVGPGVVVNLGNTDIGLGGKLSVVDGGIVVTSGTTNLDGGTLEVQVGGIYTGLSPILGSGEDDTITVHGALGAPSIDLGAGADKVTISGTIVTLGSLQMGDGNDTVEFQSNGGLILPIILGGIDGGADEDTILLSGTVDYFAPAPAVGPLFSNFEHLRKEGTNTWTLSSYAATTSFETLTLAGGPGSTLNLLGFWEFTGNSTVVMSGNTLNIGPFAYVHEMGSLTVEGGGTVNVNFFSLYRVDGLSTINTGGVVNVNDSAAMWADDMFVAGTLNVSDDAVLVANNIDVDGGTLNLNSFGLIIADDVTVTNNGVANIQSLMIAGDLLVDGTGGSATMNVGPFGAYIALGTTTVTATGTLNVETGVYVSDGAFLVSGGAGTSVNLGADAIVWARDTTTVMGSGALISVNGTGARFYSSGAVLVEGSGGTIHIQEGLFWALDTTTVQGSGGTINVDGANAEYRASGAVTVQGTNGTIVVNSGQFNALDTTTVTDQAQIIVNGGTYTGTGAVQSEGSSDIVVNDGLFNALSTTTVTGNSNLTVNSGAYQSQGAMTVTGNGDIFVNGGSFTAFDTTTVNGNGDIFVQGGTYTSVGAVAINGSGDITVTSGTFFANSTTTLNGGGTTLGVLGAGVFTAGDTITVNDGLVYGTGLINGGQILDNVGGTVAPGASIGTLFFVGHYNQAAGGNFQAEVQPGGPSDLLAITGSATLLGNFELSTLASNFGLLEQYRVISTQNPIPTTFQTATVTGAGLGSNFAWVGRVDNAGVFDIDNPATGNNVDVILATAPGALQGLTPNQQAVANYLGTVAMPGGIYIEEAIVYLITQIVGAGPNALDQIGGEVYDSFTTFSFDIARQYGKLVDDRIRTLRCASIQGAPNAFCDQGMVLLADAGPDAVATPGADSARGFSPNTHPYGWSVWVSGLGSYISKDSTSENLGYSGWTGGAMIGVDLALSKRWVVGVLVGGSKSNINFSGVGGDGDLSTVTVGVYTGWYGRRWFADAAFLYSKNWVEANRNLQFGTVDSIAKGKTEGDQYAAHATLGYGFNIRSVSLEVSGGLDWVQLRQDSFTETDAGLLSLSVNSRTDDSLRLRFGVRAAKAFAVRPGLLVVPSAKVGYAREILDNTRGITSSFGGIPGSFTVNGDEGSRNILTFGAGVKAEWSQGVTLSVNYNGEWAGDRQGHGISASVRVRW